ncbi:hypothetical protein FHS85_004825 [Rhodoligotrophos appendicifer]
MNMRSASFVGSNGEVQKLVIGRSLLSERP